VLGWVTARLIARIDDYLIETTLTTLLAYGAYLVAERLYFSGVLAVVAAGLVNGNLGPRGMSPTTRIVLFNFWEYVAFLANSLGPDRELIRVMAFGVVLFTLLVQSTTTSPLIRRLGIVTRTQAEREYEARHARLLAYLAAGKPWALPGIEELARLARDAVIVSTTDPFHHGIGYGTPAEAACYPQAGGLELARRSIEEGIAILARGDYWSYNQHCIQAKSDARDAGQVFRWLRGPLQGRILDLTYSDAAALYHAPSPTWVAGALIEWLPA